MACAPHVWPDHLFVVTSLTNAIVSLPTFARLPSVSAAARKRPLGPAVELRTGSDWKRRIAEQLGTHCLGP